MPAHIPLYIVISFGLITVLTIVLFFWVLKNSALENTRRKAGWIIGGITVWMLLQAVLTLKGVYNTTTDAMPPRIVLCGILPVIVLFLLICLTRNGKRFLDNLPLMPLTYLHVVRIPVELVLWLLFLYQAIPELMTFAGRNWDILAGITAPFIAWFGFQKKQLSRKTILLWNYLSLALLINIVVHAFLAAPSPLQQLGFDQPNIAILNFPFSWLPTVIVPIVLLGHIASMRQLSIRKVYYGSKL